MEKVNVPTEKASEPDEEARQPLEESMTPRLVRQLTKKILTFAEDTDTEKSPSQRSSTYNEVISQPEPGLSHRQKLLWLQKRRTAGLWAQCDDCNRWRFLKNVLDSYELPKKWYCRMNPDSANADCSIPQAPISVHEEDDLIYSEYSAGSVVWARLQGWPWWPAMIDDCPDTEQFYWLDGFSDIPTHYNVVFFDSMDATRAWITPEQLKPYTAYKNSFKPFLKGGKYKTRLQAAVKQADDASKLPLHARLEKFSFVTRYRGTVNPPKKVNKKDLKRHHKYLKRKFNFDFHESESDEDDKVLKSRSSPQFCMEKKNLILGTPKKTRTRASRIPKYNDNDVTVVATVVKKPLENTPSEPVLENREFVMENGNTVPGNVENILDDIEIALEKMETGKTDAEPTTDSSTNYFFKHPDSLAVQVGSTADSAMVEEPFDNDTSKTYIPDKESPESTQTTQNNTVTSEITEFQVQIASPSSDDFDF